MQIKSIFLILLITFGLSVISEKAHAESEEYESVSMINLISTPERFDGKKVVVSGYIRFYLEDQSLCLMKEPLTRKDCVWIDILNDTVENKLDREFVKKIERQWKSYNNHKASIYGVFDMSRQGHFGGWSGTIYSISKFFIFPLSSDSPKGSLSKSKTSGS